VIEPEEDEVSPLHEIHVVSWVNPKNAYPLRSSDDIEDAETLGLVTEKDTEIVLNAPVVVWPEGWQDYTIIPQAVRAGGLFPFKFVKGNKFIKLPIFLGYVDNKIATFLKTDFGQPIKRTGGYDDELYYESEDLAEEYGGNYLPLLSEVDEDILDVCGRFLIEAPCWECPRNQYSVYGEAPSPMLWRNKNWQYSPIRRHYTVDRGSNCSSVYRNADLVWLLIKNGTLDIVDEDGDATVNSPTINIPSGNTLK
jgi:hypothetical protein